MANRTFLTLVVLMIGIGASHGFYCNFETGFCDLVQDTNDNFQWSRRYGPTPTPSTGPSSGYAGSRYYAFIESSSYWSRLGWLRWTTLPKTGHKARLRTPYLAKNTYCITFAYHMYGSTIGRLNMYSERNGRRTVFWTASGNKGNSWKTYSGRRYVAEHTWVMQGMPPVFEQPPVIQPLVGPGGQIGWEAVRGSGNTGDIAIDSVSIKPCSLSCGLAMVSSPRSLTDDITKIVGGTDAPYGRWPWQVRLLYGTTSRRSHKCGGTLISNNVVMTAAHCVGDLTTSRYRVVVGEHRLDRTDAYQRTFSVSRITRHPSYRGRSTRWDNDIALIRLSSRVSYNNYIQPACLPYAFDQQPTGTSCYATGWGSTQGTGDNNILQEVQVPLVPRSECNAQDAYNGQVNQNIICAGGKGRDTCSGDSGGPLQCSDSSGRFTLYGVTSWGRGCAKLPGVYTKVSRYIHWIDNIIYGQ